MAHAREMYGVLCDPAIYEFENEAPASQAWLEERFLRLETRTSADGTETWLNWVVRLPSGELAGFVQATVLRSGLAFVAYALASRYWRQGIGSSAVAAMMQELESGHGVGAFVAILKEVNRRSMGLLRSLGFQPASPEQVLEFGAEPDEVAWVKRRGAS